MSKLQLPTVTCMIVDGLNAHRAKKVLEKCKAFADFGAVKLLTHLPIDSEHRVEIMPLTSHIMYSIWCLTEMYKHIDTSHVLIVQRDGWILNPLSWDDKWLQYDYIAPLFVQHDDVGSGGFSMRSKRLMEAVAQTYGTWDGTQGHADRIQAKAAMYEDGVISFQFKNRFNIAPKHEAIKFAAGGNKNPSAYFAYPFGFHGSYQEINHATGFVSPICEHGGENCDCRNNHLNELNNIEL